MKILNDFKEEVAKKRGYNSFDELLMHSPFNQNQISNDEAANLYADYLEQEAIKKIALEGMELINHNYKQGWNDALHWAVKTLNEAPNRSVIETEILRGLK